MARPLSRFLLVVGAVGVAHAAFVGCGSSDETKWARPEGDGGEGGEAGAPGAGTGASAAGSANGGSGGRANGGTSGSANGGGAGQPGGESGAGGAPSGGGGEGAALAGAGGDGGSGGEPSGCVPTPGSRITIGFDASNAEWVKNLQWLDSANALSVNLAASAPNGPFVCGDPVEFFGQSYGAPEGTTPSVVYAGSRATAVSCGSDVTITSTPNNCNALPQIPWQTEYHFYEGAKASQMRVTRSFGFDENTPKFTGGLRPWQARVPLATLPTVIYPNEAGTAVTTTSASSWASDHFVATGPTWNGQWFADVSAPAAGGLAVIVRRDPSMTSAVSLTINWDSFSNSNLTSFVLTQPDVGWKSPITEVEYVCFADLTSWPQAERDAATLPSWCGP